jgi:hypothetical protein
MHGTAKETRSIVSLRTLRFTPIPDDAERGAVHAVALRSDARIRWEAPQYGRQYALVESSREGSLDAAALAPRATVFSGPIIALAVSPSAPEALPGLWQALGGNGRPAGVVGCDRVADAVIVEWDLDRTPYETIETLIDVECGVYRSARSNALLSPLPLSWLARLAAYGLSAPDITADRILEVALEASDTDA